MWDLLQRIQTELRTIPELKTVEIGTEKGISAKDTPAARIVTEYREPSQNNKYFDQGVLEVVLLLDAKNDVPLLYEDTIRLEEQIRIKLTNIVLFNRTDYDKDSVTVFKVSVLRFSFSGLKNNNKECL